MFFPKAGDIITVNFDVEKELEDGTIVRYESGQEMTVLGYDDLSANQTPEQYFQEWECIELFVQLGDCHVQNMWDRSGCSDYEVSGEETYISVSEDSGLTIIKK